MNIDFTFFSRSLIYGFSFGIAAIGLSIPLRFLRVADLTTMGSIMFGGVVTIACSNSWGWLLGLASGIIATGLLGICSGLLHLKGKIPLMLAGIIVFIATQSLGLLVAGGGGEISLESKGILNSSFSWNDTVYVASLAVILCYFGGILARSKFGVLAFALTGTDRYVKFRYKQSESTTLILLFMANALVGLAGGILALKAKSAYATASHTEFLSIALGAIFAGNASMRLLEKWLRRETSEEVELKIEESIGANKFSDYWRKLRLNLLPNRDDSNRLSIILASYVLAAVLLQAVSMGVRGQCFGSIPPALEHLVVAFVIALGLITSNWNLKRQ